MDRQETYINEVNEGVPNTISIVSSAKLQDVISSPLLAIVRKVNAKVHEVVLSPAGLVHDSLQHVLVDFVRNITQHNLVNRGLANNLTSKPVELDAYGCTHVGALPNAVDINMIVMGTGVIE